MKSLAGTEVRVILDDVNWSKKDILNSNNKNKPKRKWLFGKLYLDCIVAGDDFSKGLSVVEINSGDEWVCLIPVMEKYAEKFAYFVECITKKGVISYRDTDNFYIKILGRKEGGNGIVTCPYK